MNVLAGLPPDRLLASVIYASDTPVLIVDILGRINFVNPEFEARVGLVGKMRIGAKLSRFCAAQDMARIEAFLTCDDVKPPTGKSQQVFTYIDGPPKMTACNVRVLRDTDGFRTGFACLIDIEAGGQSKAATINEERWRVALESTDQAIWETRQSHGEKFVTDSWYTLRGLKPGCDPKITTDWMTMVHPEDVPSLEDYNRKINSGEIDDIMWQYRYRHAEGHWIWIISRGRVLSRDAQGHADRIVGTDTDVTTMIQEQAQKTLLTNRLALSLEVSGVGIWEFDVANSAVYWDARVRAIYGVEDDLELRPNNDWDKFIHPDDKAEVIGYADHCFASKCDFISDYRIMRTSGEVRHVRSRAKYVHADQGSGPRFIGVNIDITDDVRKTEELEIARAAMEHDSRHDALTGLANRRKLDEVHACFMDAANADGQMPDFAIINVDLDHFKDVNDSYGHNTGDLVLKHAATLITDIVADQGLVSRIGGDEFVVFLPGPFAQTQIEDTVRKILHRASEPLDLDGQQCRFGMSIGIARSRDAEGDISKTSVAADLALYQAKTSGRGCARYYKPAMATISARLGLRVDEILHGLQDAQFTCHYRPQFAAQSRALVGLEAVVRWNHPVRGVLKPDCFFPQVEAAGIINDFMRHILQIVLSDQAKWADMQRQVPRVAVKISAQQMQNVGFTHLLDSLPIKHGRLRFQLYETHLFEAHEAVFLQNIQACRDRGIEIEIDDFGSGASSVVSVLKIAPEYIKIDSALIGSVTAGHDIVKAIVGIANLAGAQVIAKGLKTARHAAVAADIGCDILQGDGLARAMPEPELHDLLSVI